MAEDSEINGLDWLLLIRHFEVEGELERQTDDGVKQIAGLLTNHIFEKIRDRKTPDSFCIYESGERRTYDTGKVIQRNLKVPDNLFEKKEELNLKYADGYQPKKIADNLIRKNGNPDISGKIMISHREVLRFLPGHIAEEYGFKDVPEPFDLKHCEAVYVNLIKKQSELWKPDSPYATELI